MSRSQVISTVKEWSSPILLMVVFFFTKYEFEDIKLQLKELSGLKIQQAVQEDQIITIKGDLSDLIARFNNHMEALPGEEITIKKKRQ